MPIDTEAEKPITQEAAKEFVQEWISQRVPSPKGRYWKIELIWLMNELTTQCLNQTIESKEREYELETYLGDTFNLVADIQYFNQSSLNRGLDYVGSSEEDEAVYTNCEESEYIVWSRKDPKVSFKEGYGSEDYFENDKPSIHSLLVRYLKQDWLRHPFLDWVFLDMMITNELCMYGEKLKIHILPGEKNDIGMNKAYFKNRGNLENMFKVDWRKTLTSMGEKFISAILIPSAAIWATFHFGADKIGAVLAIIYAILVTGYMVFKLLKFSKSVYRRLSGKIEPAVKAMELWFQMYEVWNRLGAQVISPARVKEAMILSADMGAVWDEPSYSLIDDISKRYGANWVVYA